MIMNRGLVEGEIVKVEKFITICSSTASKNKNKTFLTPKNPSFIRLYSSVDLEQQFCKLWVGGSNPSRGFLGTESPNRILEFVKSVSLPDKHL